VIAVAGFPRLTPTTCPASLTPMAALARVAWQAAKVDDALVVPLGAESRAKAERVVSTVSRHARVRAPKYDSLERN
jgi:hypothetical protein